MMRTDWFDYYLPEELIAQFPPEQRGASRMLVLHRETGAMTIRPFAAIVAYLRPGDCLVFNDTKVMRARMYGWKNGDPGAARIEILLLRPESSDGVRWQCLLKPGKRVRPGTRVRLVTAAGEFVGDDWFTVTAKNSDNSFTVAFSSSDNELLQQRYGHVPLPPYIRRADGDLDQDRYQTIFAREAGAVAAPTAGLHFTPEILAELAAKGVEQVNVTLHVGPGTFQPVAVADVSEHHMHTEQFILTEASAATINRVKAAGGRILAVGTTSVRVLESCAGDDGRVTPQTGATDIFIYPPYRPRVVDLLLTNFHLPKSTLIMLVSAFAGREHVLAAYRLAVEERMRFYSYGDCMLLNL
ncbi:MAG: tRNA preQ1(34) S-adenosylmethionine ribosyltransferase-isomerase QueA [Victivallales bacterium]|nr:tRNA preQ1(34) S-adenosylmethionine ribosyltransferase-isomerase QueA [Victivallales bacterium]